MRRTAVILLILAGAILIGTTWHRYSDTVDEATHVGSGLELLQYHRYTLQPENPPLPRIVFAAVAMAGGMRIDKNTGDRGNAIHSVFYGQGQYRRNLIWARAGNLVFYILAALTLFLWARRESSEREALIALFLFVTQPIVLGYAGIANHDLAVTAGLGISLIALSAWLRAPDRRHAILLGVAFGISILLKFSSIGYVPIACAAIYGVRLLRDEELRRVSRRALPLLILIVPPIAALVIWAGYGFTIGTLSDLGPLHICFGKIDTWVLSRLPPTTPMPAPHFFRGIAGLLAISKGPFKSYLFGEVRNFGWWYYFPVAIAFKTTLAFFALLIAGGVAAWKIPERRWRIAEALAGGAAILAVAMTSHLDLGVRYVLPAYVPLTFAAAIATAAMLDRGANFRYAALLLMALQVGSLALAAPDYFPYFNLMGGDDPGQYLVDSNLDWGQDVLRLRSELRRLHVDRVAVNIGWYDCDQLGFPPNFPIYANERTTGWIALSEHQYRMEGRTWSWLNPYAMRRIGKSIRLYYVPPC